MAAGRKIDFTQKEMQEMTGLGRVQFKRNLERVCKMYNIKVSDFKKEEDNQDSHYTFPPEVAELLALLIKNYDYHPTTLANKQDGYKIVKATDVANYNKRIMNDIDEMEDIFMKAIYCRPGHYTGYNIAFWTEKFVKQLTRFIYNLSSLKTENVGDAMAQFTKKIDDMNYNLFRGDYFKNKVMVANEEVLPTELRMTELDKSINEQNRSIDQIIADMIKEFLPTVRKIRNEKFPEYEPTDEFIQNMSIWGFEPLKNTEDIDTMRMYYYYEKIACRFNTSLFDNNKYILEYLHEKNVKWKDRVDAIKDGSFKEPAELTVEEKKEECKKRIEYYKVCLEKAENMMKELENMTDDSEKNPLLEEMQTEFELHCVDVDRKTKRLYETVNKLVGEAIQEIME